MEGVWNFVNGTEILYDMHEFYCTAVHVLVVPGGGSLLAFRLPARVYRWGGRVGVSTLEIHVLSYLRGSPGGEKNRILGVCYKQGNLPHATAGSLCSKERGLGIAP